jgi:hypothetical protein
MEINEIKKALYREKPMAELVSVGFGRAYYTTQLENGEEVKFEVPVDDMGDTMFHLEMEAHLLNRWIVL